VQRSEARGKGRKIKKTPATSHQGDGKYPENRKDFRGPAGSAAASPLKRLKKTLAHFSREPHLAPEKLHLFQETPSRPRKASPFPGNH